MSDENGIQVNSSPIVNEENELYDPDTIESDIEESEILENSDEPELEEEEIVPPKKREKELTKTRFNQIQREKYQAIHENRALKEEIERLRNFSDLSNKAAMSNYDQAIQLKEQTASQKLTQAIENGDVQLQTEAYKDMAKIAAEQQQLNSWKAQQQLNQNSKPQQEYTDRYQYPQEQNPPELSNWISENTWFDKYSPDFDAEMADEVISYARTLDNKFIRSGQKNKLLSKEYFNEINRYVQQEIYGQESPQQNRTLTMRPSKNIVSPVSKGTQIAKAQRDRVSLTADEKDLARRLNVSDETFLKHKVEDLNRVKIDRGRGQ